LNRRQGFLLLTATCILAAGTASAGSVNISVSYSMPNLCQYVNVSCVNTLAINGGLGVNLYGESNSTGGTIHDQAVLSVTSTDPSNPDKRSYVTEVKAEGNAWTLHAYAYLLAFGENTTDFMYQPSSGYPQLQLPAANATASFEYKYVATSTGNGPLYLTPQASLSGGTASAVNSVDITTGLANLDLSVCLEDLNTFANNCSGQFLYSQNDGVSGGNSSTSSIPFRSGDVIDVSMSLRASTTASPASPIFLCCYRYVNSPDAISATEIADGADTATFTGLTATDQYGNPVPLTLSGVTASDYVPPASTDAPEPPSFLLIVAGFSMLIGTRRTLPLWI
jgi:hypothetical protein